MTKKVTMEVLIHRTPTDKWGREHPKAWFKGDQIQATGCILTYLDRLWAEWRFIDGHRKGETITQPHGWRFVGGVEVTEATK